MGRPAIYVNALNFCLHGSDMERRRKLLKKTIRKLNTLNTDYLPGKHLSSDLNINATQATIQTRTDAPEVREKNCKRFMLTSHSFFKIIQY